MLAMAGAWTSIGCGGEVAQATPDPDELYANLQCPVAFETAAASSCGEGEVVLCCPTAAGLKKMRFEITGEGRDHAIKVEDGVRRLGVSFAVYQEGHNQSNHTLSLQLGAGDQLGLALLAGSVCPGMLAVESQAVAQGGAVTESNGRWRASERGDSVWFEMTEVVAYNERTRDGAADDEPRLGEISGCIGLDVR